MQHVEHNLEGAKVVVRVPVWEFTTAGKLADTFFAAVPKELHTNHGKNEGVHGQQQDPPLSVKTRENPVTPRISTQM